MGKEILSKKEKEKVLEEKRKKQTQEKIIVANGDTANGGDTNSKNKTVEHELEKPEDDEATLRMQLLQNMKTSLEKRKDALELQKKDYAGSQVEKALPTASPRKGNIEN